MEQALQPSTSSVQGSEQAVADIVELRHTRHAKLWVLAISGFPPLLFLVSSLWPPWAAFAWSAYIFTGVYALQLFVEWKRINLLMVRADSAGLTVRAMWSGVQRMQWDTVASFSVDAKARDKNPPSSYLVIMRTRGLLKNAIGNEIMSVLPTGRGYYILKLKLDFGPEDERLRLKEFIEARLQEHGARKDFAEVEAVR
jgi:hypothetical protein